MRRSTVLAIAVAAIAISAAALTIAIAGDLPTVLFSLAWVTFSLAGGFLGARVPRNPIGWLFAAIGLTSLIPPPVQRLAMTLGTSPQDALQNMMRSAGALVPVVEFVALLWLLSYHLLAALLILFPNGRPPSPRWRVALVLIVMNSALGLLTTAVDPAPAIAFPPLAALLGERVAAGILGTLQVIAFVTLLGLVVAGGAALVVRWRRSRGVERQQLKWVAFAGGLLAFALVGAFAAYFSPLRTLDPEAPYPVTMFGGAPFAFALVMMPVASTVAIVRYRLYDIDLLINRTLVYGATSAAIAVAFFVDIVALQALLRPLTAGSDVAVAASTLVSFALFQPVRRRIQGVVDRRFDRSRYDAARTLESFADRLRDEVDLDALRADLLGAVSRTVVPAHVSLWLRNSVGTAAGTRPGRR